MVRGLRVHPGHRRPLHRAQVVDDALGVVLLRLGLAIVGGGEVGERQGAPVVALDAGRQVLALPFTRGTCKPVELCECERRCVVAAKSRCRRKVRA